jgi:hypothetical protein
MQSDMRFHDTRAPACAEGIAADDAQSIATSAPLMDDSSAHTDFNPNDVVNSLTFSAGAVPCIAALRSGIDFNRTAADGRISGIDASNPAAGGKPCFRWGVDRSNIKTAYARSMRLARHKGLVRPMDAAWGSSSIQANLKKRELLP